jgi:serine protease Do
MNQRGKLGVAFGSVALAGVVLGFGVSAKMNFTDKVSAQEPQVQTALAQTAALPAQPPQATQRPTVQFSPPQEGSLAPLAKEIGPSVVHIDVASGRGQGLGTGFIISPDGYIVTNEHVVENMAEIRVVLADDRKYGAELVGKDPATDLALIKIHPDTPLPALTLGDSDALEVGDWVMAIGSPLGLDHTVTAGIVSAKERRHISPSGRQSPYENFIQTDASINPGNSGGPLVNMKGEVVGINSAVSTQGQGISFAIPINMAKKLLPMLKSNGQVERSYMGVQIGPVPEGVTRDRQLPDAKGAYVSLVEPNSPAAKAGIQNGDVILEFDGQAINRSDDLPWLASTAGVGKTVDVVVMGQRGSRTVKMRLERLPIEGQ